MKPARIAVIAVAAVSAIGLALVVRAMGSSDGEAVRSASAEPAAAQQAPMAQVLVATRDLDVGTRLENTDMEWRAFPMDAVNAVWIVEGASSIPTGSGASAEGEGTDAPANSEADGSATAQVQRAAERISGGGVRAQVVGAVVRERILAGEPIIANKLVRAGQSGFLAVMLDPGMRAMSIPLTQENGAGGFILPGDRVDVIMSRRAEATVDGRDGFIAQTVLTNVRVLAIGETMRAGESENVVGSNATLEVGARDAEVLAFAEAQGELYLVLRSYADAQHPSGAVISSQTRADNSGSRSVRVFRNGAVSEVPVG